MVAACSVVVALQTIVSRRLDPADAAVVSVTQLLSDGARNVLPGEARILGDARSFRPEVSAEIERQMRRIAEGVAAGHGCRAETTYTREFVPLVNPPEPTRAALEAAAAVFGSDSVSGAQPPITASEDFARFLEHIPGCFAFIGNGEASLPLHNAEYDFDDASLIYGARYFAEIARRRLVAG